jgi:hypothetical protein
VWIWTVLRTFRRVNDCTRVCRYGPVDPRRRGYAGPCSGSAVAVSTQHVPPKRRRHTVGRQGQARNIRFISRRGYDLNGAGIWVRFSAEVTKCPVWLPHRTSYGGVILGVKRPGHDAVNLHIVPRLRKCRAVPRFPLRLLVQVLNEEWGRRSLYVPTYVFAG